MSKTMLFNPYNGKPRHPLDIASDPEGILMLDPDEPVRAYTTPPAPAPAVAVPAWTELRGAIAMMLSGASGKVSSDQWEKILDDEPTNSAIGRVRAATHPPAADAVVEAAQAMLDALDMPDGPNWWTDIHATSSVLRKLLAKQG